MLGFPLGSREVKASESNTYLKAVAAATDRAIAEQFATSVEGRALFFAAIGRKAWVTPAGLDDLVARHAKIRDPETSQADVDALAADTPLILWVTANVHGSEESGADAALQLVYDLADRDDCVVTDVLDNAVVFLIPVQNPDGRSADRRRNAYGFDLNRDWFARTQAETDEKVELLRRFPPNLYLDAHEFGFYRSFFPPNDDPVFHESSSQTLHWINDLYGAAIADAYTDANFAFFNFNAYDFFYPGYGDTVPTNMFQAAGITLEVYNGGKLPKRMVKQYTSYWASLATGAANRAAILGGLHDAYVEAVEQGEQGQLQPNFVQAPGNVVKVEVPDRTIRHYWIRPQADREFERRLLVRRLQRADVAVYETTAPVHVNDFIPYGRPEQAATMPAGSLVIPMAQPQKHWIQDMLNETTYPAVPAFFDVSGWSNPLLMNLDGGSSGAARSFPMQELGLAGPPVWDGPRSWSPRIGMYQMSFAGFALESVGPARWLFDNVWELDYELLLAADIAAGALDDLDVLVAPGGGAQFGAKRLGAQGRAALRDWVNGGGRYIGYRGGGARLAAKLGLTTAVLQNPASIIPGSLLRARVDPSSPLGDGIGEFVWFMYREDDVISSAPNGTVPIRYPAGGSGDFFVSGYARGKNELYSRPAAVDEAVGDGRVIVFSSDPNCRGFTQGTQRVLWNAIFGPDPSGTAPAAPAGSAARAQDEAAAKAAADALTDETELRLVVTAADESAARTVLDGRGARYGVTVAGGEASFRIANPDDLTAEEHPYAMQLPNDLEDAGVEILAYTAP